MICDVDDTIKSSGGVTIAGVPIGGVDTQYKRGTMYPGVFRFMCALSKCGITRESGTPLKVAVLTARAEELKWALQLKPTDPVCRGFSDVGNAQGYCDWGASYSYIYSHSIVSGACGCCSCACCSIIAERHWPSNVWECSRVGSSRFERLAEI